MKQATGYKIRYSPRWLAPALATCSSSPAARPALHLPICSPTVAFNTNATSNSGNGRQSRMVIAASAGCYTADKTDHQEDGQRPGNCF